MFRHFDFIQPYNWAETIDLQLDCCITALWTLHISRWQWSRFHCFKNANFYIKTPNRQGTVEHKHLLIVALKKGFLNIWRNAKKQSMKCGEKDVQCNDAEIRLGRTTLHQNLSWCSCFLSRSYFATINRKNAPKETHWHRAFGVRLLFFYVRKINLNSNWYFNSRCPWNILVAYVKERSRKLQWIKRGVTWSAGLWSRLRQGVVVAVASLNK